MPNRDVPRRAMKFLASAVEVRANGEDSKTAPVSLLARTGKPIEHWFWGRIVHDLSGMKLHKPRLPIDWVHSEELIGTLNKFDISTGDLVASGFLKKNPARQPDHAAIVMADMQGDDSIPYEASINWGGDGCVIEEVGQGASVEVNGYQFSGPGVVVREWPLRGVAICPYGADQNTQTNVMNESETVSVTYRKPSNPSEVQSMSQTTAEAAVTNQAVETVKPESTLSVTEAAPGAAVEVAQPDPKPHAVFVELFGDSGARWFLEGKSLADASKEFIRKQADEIARLTAENAGQKATLAAVPNGNQAATFVAERPKSTKPEPSPKMEQNLSPGMARFAAGLKLPASVKK